MRGRKQVKLWRRYEVRANRILMQIIAPHPHVFLISNPMVREATLPNGHLGRQPMREAALDKPYRALKDSHLRCHYEMHMVRHHHIGVQLVMARSPVVL